MSAVSFHRSHIVDIGFQSGSLVGHGCSLVVPGTPVGGSNPSSARKSTAPGCGFTPGDILENRVLAGKLVNREADLRIARALASKS